MKIHAFYRYDIETLIYRIFETEQELEKWLKIEVIPTNHDLVTIIKGDAYKLPAVRIGSEPLRLIPVAVLPEGTIP